jgi:hypothetical protein
MKVQVSSLRLSVLPEFDEDVVFFRDFAEILVSDVAILELPEVWEQLDLNAFLEGDTELLQRFRTCADSVASAVDVLIVDLMISNSRTGYHGTSAIRTGSIVEAIEAMCESLARSPVSIVVLTDNALNETDLMIAPRATERWNRGALFGVNRSGHYWSSGKDLAVRDRKRLVSLLSSRLPGNVEQFKLKLLRQVGWFAGPDTSSAPTRFYYDARFGSHELSTLIADFVKVARPDTDCLVFESSTCHWIAKPAIAAAHIVGVRYLDLSNPGLPADGIRPTKTLLVTPMVFRGHQLSTALSSALAAGYPISHVLTVLRGRTDIDEVHETKRHARTRQTSPGLVAKHVLPAGVGLDHLFEVPQQEGDTLDGFSPIPVPYPLQRDTTAPFLTISEYLSILSFAGHRDSISAYDRRVALPARLPNFEKASQLFGPWIAVKLFALVNKEIDDVESAESYLLIFPGEPGGCRFVKESLQAIYGVDTIIVERNDLSDPNANWIRQVEQSRADVFVFMDELCCYRETAQRASDSFRSAGVDDPMFACILDLKGPSHPETDSSKSLDLQSLFQLVGRV